MGKDTPEQARLRKAVEAMAADISLYSNATRNLLAAAEAMLPKREAWADYSVCEVAVDTDIQTEMVSLTYDGYIQSLVSFGEDYIADRAQSIRAACLLKHSKRLMEQLNRGDWCAIERARDAINAEAERLIGEPAP